MVDTGRGSYLPRAGKPGFPESLVPVSTTGVQSIAPLLLLRHEASSPLVLARCGHSFRSSPPPLFQYVPADFESLPSHKASGARHTDGRLCFERARLQSCRKWPQISRALAPEGRFWGNSIPNLSLFKVTIFVVAYTSAVPRRWFL
jgi:hypothetical protein